MTNTEFKLKAIENYLNNKNRNLKDDPYIDSLVILIDNAIKYISQNTGFSEDELYEILNKNVAKIKLINGFEEEDDYRAIQEDQKNKVIRFHREQMYTIHEENELNIMVITEIIHALSSRKIKQSPLRTVTEIGYEEVVEKTKSKDEHKNNITFNNAIIEYFSHKMNENQKRFFSRMEIEGSSDIPAYCISINLIKQMMIAKGISDEELFKGLINKDSREKIIKNFDEDVFKDISKNLDALFIECTEYCSACGTIWETEKKVGMEPNYRTAVLQMAVKQRLFYIENLILKQILLPELKGKTEEERKRILNQYKKFLMSDREMFVKETGHNLEEYLGESIENGMHSSSITNGSVTTPKKNNNGVSKKINDDADFELE